MVKYIALSRIFVIMINPKCKNIHCINRITDYEIEKLQQFKESRTKSNQSKYRFCIKCRARIAKDIIILSPCSDCSIPISIHSYLNHKCKKCTEQSRIIRAKRRYDKDRKPVVKIHKQIIKLLQEANHNPISKEFIKNKFGLNEGTFKTHMAAAKKELNIERVISYKVPK